MGCSKSTWQLQLYLDRQLTLDQMRTLEMHVSTCPSCQRELLLLEVLIQDLRDIRSVPEAPDLTVRIMQRVAFSTQVQRESSYALLRPSMSELLAVICLSTLVMFGVILGQPSLREMLPIANGHDPLSQAFIYIAHLFIDVNSGILMGGFWIVGTILGVWITLALAGEEMRSTWLKAMMDHLPVW